MQKNPHKAKNLLKMPSLTMEQAADMNRIEREAFANFGGSFDDLEAALGMLRIGHFVGWRVLVLIHNKRTIRRYEEILGINIREYFPPVTPSSERSIGYKIALGLGNFWKAVSGAIKIENRREFADRIE